MNECESAIFCCDILQHTTVTGREGNDDMMNEKIHDFFNDDGTPVNPNIVPKPSLCVSCLYDDDPEQETLCMLNRMDQHNTGDFKCFAYRQKDR